VPDPMVVVSFRHIAVFLWGIKHTASLKFDDFTGFRRCCTICISIPIDSLTLCLSTMKYLSSLTVAFLLLQLTQADYASDAESAIKLLQDKWYSTETGLWYVNSSLYTAHTKKSSGIICGGNPATS
jgi:hypothetical protein